jgi:mono/diheme cytochrome c family protein
MNMTKSAMSRKNTFLATALAAVLGCATPAGFAGDLERGQALHDTFCIMCHSPDLYGRSDRIANTYAEVLQQVTRWQNNARLRWTGYDIDSVTEYLAEKYYKVPR